MGRMGGWMGTSRQGDAEYFCLGTFWIYPKYHMVQVSLNEFSVRAVKLECVGCTFNRTDL